MIGLEDSKIASVVLGSTFDIRDSFLYGLGCFYVWIWDSKRLELLAGIMASNGLALLYIVNFMFSEFDFPLLVVICVNSLVVLVVIISITRLHFIGDFKGVIQAKYHRGISHGDIIDLKREDYSGFDVREFYVQMVKELKEIGY